MKTKKKEKSRSILLETDLGLTVFLAEHLLGTLEHFPQDLYNEHLITVLKQLRMTISKNIDR